MDRNGKKPKAAHADLHAERSDTKTQTRDALGRSASQSRAKADETKAGAPPKPRRG